MDELVQELYSTLLDKHELLSEAINSPSPYIVLTKFIRLDQAVNPGKWGLLECMGYASEFLHLYETQLNAYKISSDQP
jgi:hypothetical protein